MILNGRFLTHRVTGVQRFAREIVRASVEEGFWNNQTIRLVTPASPDLPREFAGLDVEKIGKNQGHIWEQIDLPRMVDGEYLINLCNTAPIFKKRQMVVLHGAALRALPSNFTLKFRAWYNFAIRCYGFNSKIVATVSKFSADEIAKYYGVKRKNIEIIPESGEHILKEIPDYSLHEKFNLEPGSYFLAVSSYARNKNFSSVVRAVAKLANRSFKFVVVGGRDATIFNEAGIDVSGAVEVGYVTDSQLRALYERAACFVFPSLYEGWGLPPMEAMACGCPVLVSNTSALPEVCGYGAAYCDPYDVDDIAKQLDRLLGSEQARNELREAGLSRSKEWTWANAARRLSEIRL